MFSFRMILSRPNGHSGEGYSNDSSLLAAERRNVYRKGSGPGFYKHLVPPGPQTKELGLNCSQNPGAGPRLINIDQSLAISIRRYARSQNCEPAICLADRNASAMIVNTGLKPPFVT